MSVHKVLLDGASPAHLRIVGSYRGGAEILRPEGLKNALSGPYRSVPTPARAQFPAPWASLPACGASSRPSWVCRADTYSLGKPVQSLSTPVPVLGEFPRLARARPRCQVLPAQVPALTPRDLGEFVCLPDPPLSSFKMGVTARPASQARREESMRGSPTGRNC